MRMEFSFEVDPDLDLAVGTELSFDDEAQEFGDEAVSLAGVNPKAPTEAKPGSEDKVRMLAARYAAGVPLWHDSDCYDHGPTPVEFLGEGFASEDEEEDEF
jgi:hypothetical protein